MDELAECPESSTSVVEEARKCDIFSKAIDIAKYAHGAKVLAEQSEEKARFIEKLAARARQEADGVHAVADTLASTAATVASLGLDACKYQSYWDAFSRHFRYSEKMDFDSFMEVVGKQEDRMGMFRRQMNSGGSLSPMDSQIPAASRWSESSSCGSSVGSRGSSNWNAGPSVNTGDRSNGNGKLIQRGSAGAFDPDKPAKAAPAHTRLMGNRSGRRFSLPPSLPTSQESTDTEDDTSEKFQEKFPFTPTQFEYKETLASSFDSSCMLPLWEDRYVSGFRKGEKSEETVKPSNRAKNWTEKKAIKQLNIKLHKDLDDSSEDLNAKTTGVDRRQAPPVTPRPAAPIPRSDEESCDEEVDEIMFCSSEPPMQVQKLKNMEHIATGQATLGATLVEEKLAHAGRAVSPLLSSSEKEAYTVEETKHPSSPKAIQKHIFHKSEKPSD